MQLDILTLFPGFFGDPHRAPESDSAATGVLSVGVVGRAFREGLAQVRTHDLRHFTHDRHRTVDDRPFGGGEGMVLKPQPIFDCIHSLDLEPRATRDTARHSVILLSAQGRRFDQSTARRLATLQRLVLICGRYEGVDERVATHLCDAELSIGDFVLSGGELAAAVVLDAVVRLLPGVLGHQDSSRFESFGEPASHLPAAAPDSVPASTNPAGGLLDYPHYTRPADFHGLPIPEPLASGDHLAIRRWRRQAALAKTLANRPDLLASAPLSDDDRRYLATLGYSA